MLVRGFFENTRSTRCGIKLFFIFVDNLGFNDRAIIFFLIGRFIIVFGAFISGFLLFSLRCGLVGLYSSRLNGFLQFLVGGLDGFQVGALKLFLGILHRLL